MPPQVRPIPSFWVIAVLLLVWEGIGAAVYLNQADNGMLSDVPTFVAALFGISVWSGVAAAVLLLLRRRWSAPLFLLSVIAATIQFAHILFGRAAWQVVTIGGVVIAIGIFATWYAVRAQRRGWLY
ncbi:hypothetical protein [Pacificimonas flava]|uniref:Uncharacterized protein n=1 Tax=Pacificimonas flava TaxID=1234595 RepID=M2U691_9SPHN|nr:hypothetical protein [Pacificimonas flava]EMD83528.1 hypothetical protein C725_1429 [Pacificimonas flava]MBB5278919.1 presenilin-like A22 family membrane protease [Pacificimonas flava]